MAVVFLILVASVVVNALQGQASRPAPTKAPIQLVSPRLTGVDDKGRPFAITAASAVRDPQQYQRVVLKEPVLTVDEKGPDHLKITGRDGVYNEGTRKLEVTNGVQVASARGSVQTNQSVFDTKTGEVVGNGPIQTAVGGNTTSAGSYAVTDKGRQVIYKGGVRSRINVK
jgi:lipopolysaccharide export system protein LptC